MKQIRNTGWKNWMISLTLLSLSGMVSGQNTGLEISGTDCSNGLENFRDFTSDTTACTYFKLGMQFDINGDYESAIEEYDKAISHNTNFAEAFDRRGISYTKLIKYKRALKDFNKAIELKNSFTDAYSHRGIVYYCLGEFENAIADYDRALELNPNYAKAYYNRGIVKLILDDEPGAIEDIRIASDMNVGEAFEYLKTIKLTN
jgi:tetratricopeptide (TPR) repeat protein